MPLLINPTVRTVAHHARDSRQHNLFPQSFGGPAANVKPRVALNYGIKKENMSLQEPDLERVGRGGSFTPGSPMSDSKLQVVQMQLSRW